MGRRKQRKRAERHESPARSVRSRVDVGIALAVAALAWILRVAFVASNRDRDWPFTVFYEGDARPYFLFARALIRGEPYDQGIPFHPPGFAAVLGGVHRLLGAGAGAAEIPHFGVKVVLAGIASLGVGGLFLLVRPYLGRGRAAVAAVLAASSFGLIVLGVAPVTEGVATALCVAVLLVWSRGFEHRWAAPADGTAAGVSGRRRWIAGLAFGLLAGALALTRAESVAWTGALGVLGLITSVSGGRGGPSRRRRAAPWLLAAIAFALVLLPWTLANREALERTNRELEPWLAEPLPTFVPLTIYGPLNLALANHDGADGTFSRSLLPGGATAGVLDFRRPEHLRLVLHGDAVAAAWILGNPADFASLAARKWALAFGGALRFGFGRDDWPAGLTGVRRPVDVFVPDRPVMVWILGPLVLAGAVLAWREGGAARRWLEVVLLLTAVRAAIVALFFGYARHGALLLPFWFTLVAVALAAGGAAVTGRLPAPARGSLRKAAPIAAALLLVAFLIHEIRGVGADRSYRATGTTLAGSSKLNPDLEVRLEPIEP